MPFWAASLGLITIWKPAKLRDAVSVGALLHTADYRRYDGFSTHRRLLSVSCVAQSAQRAPVTDTDFEMAEKHDSLMPHSSDSPFSFGPPVASSPSASASKR